MGLNVEHLPWVSQPPGSVTVPNISTFAAMSEVITLPAYYIGMSDS